MNTGIHDAIVISEVLRSNASMIDHYNWYMNSCQDQQLRSLLDHQQRHTLASFQKLTNIMQSHGMDVSNIPLPTTMSFTGSSTMSTNTSASASTPSGSQWTAPQYNSMQAGNMPYPTQQSSSASMLNDRSIAEGALHFHKYGADVTTKAALESSEPHIRTALTNMAGNCIEMSYEIYSYMSQRGWYQLPNSPQKFVSHAPQQQQQYNNQ